MTFEPGTPPAAAIGQSADDHVLATWLAETAGRRLLEVRGEGLEGKELKDAGDAAAHELLMTLVAEHPEELVRDQYVMRIADRCLVSADEVRRLCAAVTQPNPHHTPHITV